MAIVAIILRKSKKEAHSLVAKASDRPAPVPPCIFCDKESGSEEHLWPDWVHRFIREHGIDLGGLRVQEGISPEIIDDDLEKTINTVCHTCNNAWMSRIEDKNRPRFMLMLQNISPGSQATTQPQNSPAPPAPIWARKSKTGILDPGASFSDRRGPVKHEGHRFSAFFPVPRG